MTDQVTEIVEAGRTGMNSSSDDQRDNENPIFVEIGVLLRIVTGDVVTCDNRNGDDLGTWPDLESTSRRIIDNLDKMVRAVRDQGKLPKYCQRNEVPLAD